MKKLNAFLAILPIVSALAVSCQGSEGRSEAESGSYTDGGEDAIKGMDQNSRDRYERLSSEGKSYVDEQMKKYDECVARGNC